MLPAAPRRGIDPGIFSEKIFLTRIDADYTDFQGKNILTLKALIALLGKVEFAGSHASRG
jgi:hypothetical protein